MKFRLFDWFAWATLSLAWFVFFPAHGVTQETSTADGAAPEITTDTVLEGLHNPTCVAIQPGTNHLFIADSGAQRIVRVVDGKVEEVIVGFSGDVYGKVPVYKIGPLSLHFIDQETLLVGTGGRSDGNDRLCLYKIPEVGAEPIKADQTVGKPMILKKTEEEPGEGDFFAMTQTARGIFVTCNGNDQKGWIGLATLDDEGKLKSFERSFALKPEVKVNGPVALTFSPDGYLAIGLMGKTGPANDSVLVFCDPGDGKILASFKTGMKDITGLAYGPKRGRLFATDFSWADPSQGALVKLVGKGEQCEARKILALEKPTSLVFSPKGDLYITLAGNRSDGEHPDGKLIVVRGLDKAPPKNVLDEDEAESE